MRLLSNVWSENTASFKRLMEIHSYLPILYYGFNMPQAKPTWVNGAMLMQQIQPVNAGPQSRPCNTCWDAHFLKMNAAWKIWWLLMRRLFTVQEPGQKSYDPVQGWRIRKKKNMPQSQLGSTGLDEFKFFAVNPQ